MLTLIIFLLILGLLVLSHEFGHFVAARKSGMKVYEFGFGFPPRLFGIQILKRTELKKIAETEIINIEERRGLSQTGEVIEEIITDETREVDVVTRIKRWRIIWGGGSSKKLSEEAGFEAGTIYSLNWIPLGGFVKIKGEEGEEEGSDSFVSQSFTKKAITLFAGVFMNVVLATVILSIGYMIGLPQALGESADLSMVQNRELQIIQVVNGKPAQIAGVIPGDIILKIDALENPRLKEMQEYVDNNKDKEVAFSFKRGDEIIEKKIMPLLNESSGKGGIGVGISEVGTVKYPWHTSIYYGIIDTGYYLKEILFAFYVLIRSLIIGSGTADALSGPVGIAVMTGQAAKLGLNYLLNFTAILSLNLAIINILPIPALDGGRILFLAFGRIFGRKVPLKYEQVAHSLGFLALMGLVVFVTIKDIGRFSGAIMSFVGKIF